MRIRELREAAGLSQADVMRAMNVDSAAVCRWESGKVCPRASKLPALADLFHCTIDALYGREPPGAEEKNADSAAVCRWESGKVCPRASKLPALADLFHCTIDALYGREPPGAEEKNAG